MVKDPTRKQHPKKSFHSFLVISNWAPTFALTAVAVIFLTRIAIWFPPSFMHLWTIADFWHALAACWQDSLVLICLLGVHISINRFVKTKSMRQFISCAFIMIYWLFSFSLVLNTFSIFSLGSTLNLKWLTYLVPSNVGLSWPIIKSIITPSMAILFTICLLIIPAALIVLKVGKLGLRFAAASATFLFVISSTFHFMLPPRQATFDETTKKNNPQLASIRSLLFPTDIQKYLEGQSGIYPNVERQLRAEGGLANVLPNGACCKNHNIVMITIDSVPLKSMNREFVLAKKNNLPNLARLYREGMAFERFYTNYPSSTEAHGVITGSVYASNDPTKTSISEWTGRSIPTLSETLAKQGYDAALFMSDDLAYDGVLTFLRGRGFSQVSDSTNVSCQKNDAEIRARYGHKGDDCNALAAAKWLRGKANHPFFLWAWFTNTHTPYYSNKFAFADEKASMAERHAKALQDTDHAVGIILSALDAVGLAQNTIVILSADHGEAFGEHGLFYHGTSLFEEQVHIPLIIKANSMQKGGVNRILGSTIDLAPTLTNMVGIEAPLEWQGNSLFSATRPARVFVSSLSAGHLGGYVEGNYKYVISSLLPDAIKYDLETDPNELRPIALTGDEAKYVMARIGAFTRSRNKMRWPIDQKAYAD